MRERVAHHSPDASGKIRVLPSPKRREVSPILLFIQAIVVRFPLRVGFHVSSTSLIASHLTIRCNPTHLHALSPIDPTTRTALFLSGFREPLRTFAFLSGFFNRSCGVSRHFCLSTKGREINLHAHSPTDHRQSSRSFWRPRYPQTSYFPQDMSDILQVSSSPSSFTCF